MGLRRLMQRLRGLSAGEAVSLLVPARVDLILYEGPSDCEEVAHTLKQDVSIRRYSHGDPLPAHLPVKIPTADRMLYVMVDDETGGLIHTAAVMFSTLLPARFGYDPFVPVIGDCHTRAPYRAHRVYPHVLGHILKDLRKCRLASTAYVLVSPRNLPSIAGIERAGFKRVARLQGWRVAGLMIRRIRGRH